jgi:lysyl-tRNA synthetase class 1
MRWVALGVDYEMAGKDLIDSVKLSGKICRALGGTPPEGFNYELFLDEKGQKISKSKGNGLTIDEWLRYASAGIAVAVHVSASRRRRSGCTST